MNYKFNKDEDKNYIEIIGDKPEIEILNIFINSIVIGKKIELIFKIKEILQGNISKFEKIYEIRYININKDNVIICLDADNGGAKASFNTIEFLEMLEKYVNEYSNMLEVDEEYFYKK